MPSQSGRTDPSEGGRGKEGGEGQGKRVMGQIVLIGP